VSLSGCEDKEKTSEEKTETAIEVTVDSTVVFAELNTKNPKKSPSDSEPTKTPEVKYPEITNENVVEFLTEYGKDHPETKVRISTQYGDIDLELYEDTPLHRANFIYLVKQDYFDGTFFHRVVPNFIIQGGNSDTTPTPRKRRIIGKNYLLPAELQNGRTHRYGTLSGAKEYRENPDKNSAPFEFFIFLGPQSSTGHLNGNYTIFGKVTRGMDVVEVIANLPSDEGDWPLQNVYIKAEVLQ
jgi:peptidylprolyl isomerase